MILLKTKVKINLNTKDLKLTGLRAANTLTISYNKIRN